MPRQGRDDAAAGSRRAAPLGADWQDAGRDLLGLAPGGVLLVDRDDLGRDALGDDAALLEQDRPVAELGPPSSCRGSRGRSPWRSATSSRTRAFDFSRKTCVAGREDLVEQQDVGVDRRRDREAEPRPHARRVGLDRRVDERAESANSMMPGDRRSIIAPWSRPRNAPARRMLSRPRQLLVEAGAEGQQARDLAVDLDDARRRHDDPGEDLEERALAGAVRPDDRQRLAVDEVGR